MIIPPPTLALYANGKKQRNAWRKSQWIELQCLSVIRPNHDSFEKTRSAVTTGEL